MPEPRSAAAIELLAYALHLRQNGERAPGGDETWAEFDRRAEELLRRWHDASAVAEPEDARPRFYEQIVAPGVPWLTAVTVEVPAVRDEVILTVHLRGFHPQSAVFHYDEKLCGPDCRFDADA